MNGTPRVFNDGFCSLNNNIFELECSYFYCPFLNIWNKILTCVAAFVCETGSLMAGFGGEILGF